MNESAAPSIPTAFSADGAPWPRRPSPRRSAARAGAVAVLLGAVAAAGFAATPAAPSVGASQVPSTSTPVASRPAEPAPRRADGHWGAIAARPDGHGHAYNQPSRAVAEQLARAQCERATGPSTKPGTVGGCEVRVWFERSCGALATGNFGEWGAATGADKAAATKAALAQCDAHLPTEPCRAVVSVCSLP